ncbi:MAG TPA: molybdopterin-dependent oxidoreductase [Arsenophonus apicola]|uniref:molybdopterin-dependent oxidoreductase n=1 Tax=Arsenophonus apicola TaxID=2879119 RepID=UPI001CDD6823|nr:molybdopterin-dependent oxidoreductase [Arsenophonus apicola]UBX30759.1 molybdopterin-dependent oxidoreductase [Arsenophonus apicola]
MNLKKRKLSKIYNLLMVLVFISISANSEIDYLYLKKDGETIKITRHDLEKLPSHSIVTSTNFTKKNEFLGVKFKEILNKYKITATTVRAFAYDNYSFTLPVKELLDYEVILAYKKNGDYMELSELGPFVIIYPRDSYPDLDLLSVNAKTVWQIKLLEFK